MKKAVLYAKSQCGLKPCFQAMQDEEIVYYLDHLADTEGENLHSQDALAAPAAKDGMEKDIPAEKSEENEEKKGKVIRYESDTDGQQVLRL